MTGVLESVRGAVSEKFWPQSSPVKPPVPSPELELGDYRLARAVDKRPLPAAQLKHLEDADEALRQTRAMLVYGRGNVASDVLASRGASYRRTIFARRITEDLVAGPPRSAYALPKHIAISIAAREAQAGRCSEFTELSIQNALLSGDRSKSIASMDATDSDHAWAKINYPGGFGEPASTVIVDAHRATTPLLEEDTVYPGMGAEEIYRYSNVAAAKEFRGLHEVCYKNLSSLLPALKTHERIASGVAVPENFPENPSILEPEFQNRVANRLESARSDHAEHRRQMIEAEKIARQNGCSGQIHCDWKARQLLEHLEQVWPAAVSA